MTPEEIRMRCVEAAASLQGHTTEEVILVANKYEKYVTGENWGLTHAQAELNKHFGTLVGIDSVTGETVIL